MSCSTKKENGSGFESQGVLVVRLPLSVQSFEADSILDKAEGLIRQADLVWDKRINDENNAEFVVRAWWQKRPVPR